MISDRHKSFQHMIDESLAGALSAGKERSLREHLARCAPCQEYLSANNRVIAGLSGFSFDVNPTLNTKVLAALKLQTQQVRVAQPRRRRFMRKLSSPFKVLAAFAGASSMSVVGSALVYQVARLLTVPTRFSATQVQAAVLVFWLLPSFCSALCLLAAPGGKRGFA